MADHEDLCTQLESIGEALVDRSMAVLREAIENGADAHPIEEKELARAQRAIAKAVQILRHLDDA